MARRSKIHSTDTHLCSNRRGPPAPRHQNPAAPLAPPPPAPVLDCPFWKEGMAVLADERPSTTTAAVPHSSTFVFLWMIRSCPSLLLFLTHELSSFSAIG